MNINTACSHILSQLHDLIDQISDEDFVKQGSTLSGSTIGQHVRHTLEFFIMLENGVRTGLINYDNRAHDKVVERDKQIALAVVKQIQAFVTKQSDNVPIVLEIGYDLRKEDVTNVETNYLRELVYNIEHAVHHMAIIKIGIKEIAPYIILPRDFGVAASTIRYQDSIVASH